MFGTEARITRQRVARIQLALRRFTTSFAVSTLGLTATLGPAVAATAADVDKCPHISFTDSQTTTPVEIRYGMIGAGEEPLALLWADKENYPNNGKYYVLKPQKYTANDRNTATQAGQIDAGSISLTALVTSVSAGLNLRAVATIVETSETDNQGAFITLADSDIKTAADLRGKRIGYYGPNTISEYWIKSAMEKAGVKPDEAKYVSLPAPAQEQALRNKQIDVAWLARQFLAKASKTGGINKLFRPIDATKQRHPSTLVYFDQAFVEKNPVAYCAWRNDYQKALGEWENHRKDLYPKLISAKYLTPAAANAGPDGGRTEGGVIRLSDIQKTIDDMVATGFLPKSRTTAAENLIIPGYSLAQE